MNNELGIGYDQRNTLVVGLAMGFAVIPMIFSIAEDAIFSVPKHLTTGSLALGRHHLANHDESRVADRQSRHIFRGHDRFWPRGWRNHDCLDGHRQHASHGS